MKTWILILVIALGVPGCSKSLDEPPLTLLPGAEPSAKSRNDLGIEHYRPEDIWRLYCNLIRPTLPTQPRAKFTSILAWPIFRKATKKKPLKIFARPESRPKAIQKFSSRQS